MEARRGAARLLSCFDANRERSPTRADVRDGRVRGDNGMRTALILIPRRMRVRCRETGKRRHDGRRLDRGLLASKESAGSGQVSRSTGSVLEPARRVEGFRQHRKGLRTVGPRTQVPSTTSRSVRERQHTRSRPLQPKGAGGPSREAPRGAESPMAQAGTCGRTNRSAASSESRSVGQSWCGE